MVASCDAWSKEWVSAGTGGVRGGGGVRAGNRLKRRGLAPHLTAAYSVDGHGVPSILCNALWPTRRWYLSSQGSEMVACVAEWYVYN